MDKFAQARNMLDKLREKTNLTGMAAEKFFNKEFGEAMAKLRVNDDQIRRTMLGETAGSQFSMKELLAMTKSSLNRREYIEAFTDLGKIHNQLISISELITGIKADMSAVHEDILLKKYKDNDKMSPKDKEKVLKRRQELLELQKRLANYRDSELVKTAGLMDFFKNIGTDDGRARMAWEKRYPDEVKKWRTGTSAMLESAKYIYDLLIQQLKVMAKARSSRNLDNYINAADPLLKPISDFDKSFRSYYQNAIQPLIKKLELDNPGTPAETSQAPKEVSEKEVNPDVKPLTVNPDPFPQQLGDTLVSGDAPNLSSTQQISEPLLNDLMKKELATTTKSAHAQFYRVLEKFSNESPLILKSIISKYAASIINSDLKTSIKLSKIASAIKVEE